MLSRKLHPVASQWHSLGIQLGFNPEELRIIQQQVFFDPVNALSRLLEKWLNRSDPPSTLESIVEVVGGEVIANGQLSKKLQDCDDFPSVRSKQPAAGTVIFSMCKHSPESIRMLQINTLNLQDLLLVLAAAYSLED